MTNTLESIMNKNDLTEIANEQYLMVGDFHDEYNIQRDSESFKIDDFRNRYALIREEYEETVTGIYGLNKKEIADGLCDILYFLYGTIHICGWPTHIPNFEELNIDVINPDNDDIEKGKDFVNSRFISYFINSESIKNSMIDMGDIVREGIGDIDFKDREIFLINCLSMIKSILCVYVSTNYWLNIVDNYEEVHRSNMDKVCLTVEDAQKTVEVYGKSNGDPEFAYFVPNEKTGKYLVKRTSDDKVLKRDGWTPPNIILNVNDPLFPPS
tara:strand:- start:104 stop:910 length:807 start_codon:yes stop_codon:yes gene_type:complete